MDEDVTPQLLDRATRARLRTLTKDNADRVAQHLVMAGRLVDVDPELAYAHARAAARRAGRVDVAREAVALTAYATGRYAEALREVRTVRRLSGQDVHPAIEADAERGLGRPERALAVVAAAKQRELSVAETVELTLVESGARADLGEHEAALLVVEKLLPSVRRGEPRSRLLEVLADRLEALGRDDEAAAARQEAGVYEPEPDLVVVDLLDDDVEEPADVPAAKDAPAATAVGSPTEADADVPEDLPAEGETERETAQATRSEPAPSPRPEPEADLTPPEGREEDPTPASSPEPGSQTTSAPVPEPTPVPEREAGSTPASEPETAPDPEPPSEPPSRGVERPAPSDAEQGQLDLFTDIAPEDRP